tara:strand:+ start:1029 stop:1832 length:804 start_codon:yes stop_codon:yes gene_type:complete
MDTLLWIISKVFWTIFSPNRFLFLLLFIGVCFLYLGREKLGKRLITTVTAILLFFGLVPVGTVLLVPLENRFPIPEPLPEKIDGVIVLGGSEIPMLTKIRGQASLSGAVERLTIFLSLARRFPEAKLVYAGGQGAINEQEYKAAHTAKLFFEQMDLDTDRVLFDSQSRNTMENAQNALQLAKPEEREKWVLVTSAWHMARSVGIFRKLGWQVIPYPVDYKTTGKTDFSLGIPSLTSVAGFSNTIYEWTGLFYYWLLGRTSELFPGPI